MKIFVDYLGPPVLSVIFVALLVLQWRFPLRRQHFSALHRLIRNLVPSIPSHALLRWAMLPVAVLTAGWARDCFARASILAACLLEIAQHMLGAIRGP